MLSSAVDRILNEFANRQLKKPPKHALKLLSCTSINVFYDHVYPGCVQRPSKGLTLVAIIENLMA